MHHSGISSFLLLSRNDGRWSKGQRDPWSGAVLLVVLDDDLASCLACLSGSELRALLINEDDVHEALGCPTIPRFSDK
jgi:hypothetical protein